MVLDRRVPAIYVDIEDRSTALPTIETGESVFGVLLSDRGPHNRVVEIEPQDTTRFYKLFGRPNYMKFGQGHYAIDKAIQMGARAYIVRPVALTEDDAISESSRMAIANAFVKYNDPNGSSELIRSTTNAFIFDGSTTVVCNSLSVELFEVGDWIMAVDDATKARQITTVTNNPSTATYTFTLASAYPDTVTVDDAYKYYPGSTLVAEDFVFTNGSNIVTAVDTTSVLSLTVEDWIYSADDLPSAGEEAVYARQIIAIDTTTGQITLDSAYTGTTSTPSAEAYIYVPFVIEHQVNVRSEDNFDTQDVDNLWYFYAYGAGEYYNDIYITGVRNVEFEKIYMSGDVTVTNDSPEILYPYLFMDLSIYKKNDDGSSTLMEGPWTVSLVNMTADNQLIRDPNTGKELYIKTVINERSELVQCEEALGSSILLTRSTVATPITYPYTPDDLKRLQVQSLFAEGTIITTNTRGLEGFYLEKGENGNLFTSTGMINFTDDYKALVAKAYAGTLPSTDGSIELVVQSIYPWYTFEYIVCGGYTAAIANAARQLADVRDDTLLLSDTCANNSSADDDVTARLNDVPWNTYNAGLYVQYREITDVHTGKKFYINPVYHAIERHLAVDAQYWIAEPVANVEKGAIQEPIKLSYRASLTKLGDLLDVELNPVIVEPDGKYILSQFTTWKRLSVLKRMHVIKFLHYCKREIPKVLKDLLQRKATGFWIGQASARINAFMQPFVDSGSNERLAAITSYTAAINFDELRSEINVVLDLKMIRAIERIHVNIRVS
jgi:hypothetical protein